MRAKDAAAEAGSAGVRAVVAAELSGNGRGRQPQRQQRSRRQPGAEHSGTEGRSQSAPRSSEGVSG